MSNQYLHEIAITAIISKNGIYDELVMADKKLKGQKVTWQRF